MTTSSFARRSTAPSALAALSLLLAGCASVSGLTTFPSQTLNVGRGPALAFSPSGEFVATSGDFLRIWRVRDGALAATFDCPASVSALAFSHDARWLAGTLGEGPRETRRVFLWSVPDRSIAARIAFPTGRSLTNGPIAFTPEGDLVALVSSGVRGTVLARWSRNGEATERPLGPHGTPESPKNRRFHDPCVFRGDFALDGSVVAVGRQDKDGVLELWCCETGQRLLVLEDAARATAFAISDELVAAAVAPNVVRVWSRQDGKVKADLKSGWAAGEDTLWSLAFSPSGDLVAGGGLAGHIHVWSVATGKLLEEIRGHGSVICALAFSPRGDVLASAGWNGAVKFWDIEGGSPR